MRCGGGGGDLSVCLSIRVDGGKLCVKMEKGVGDPLHLFSSPIVNLKRKLGILAVGFAEGLSVQVDADVESIELM